MNLAMFLPLTLNSFIDSFYSMHLAYISGLSFMRSDAKSRRVEIKKPKANGLQNYYLKYW